MVFETAKKNLEALGYTVTCFETAAEAAAYLDGQIDGRTVGFGGSMTLDKLGIYERLKTHNTVYWHHRLAEGETSREVRMQAMNTEVYLSSVNALAETGEIVNIDGTCNRVASIFYGHDKVYLVAGVNKLTKDYDSALYRARNVASPKNARRFHVNTPCAKNADRCYDCKSPERICKGLSVLWGKPQEGEYEIVLINEELGF